MSKLRQSKSFSVPAPVGGLNAYDAIAAMPETDAIVMRNFWPEAFGVSIRKGFKEHATGFDGEVGTIMRYNSVKGNRKLFAIDQSFIYDISLPGAVDVPDQVCPSTKARWNWTNTANPAETWLIAFNGKDDGFLYAEADGYHALVAGDGTTPYTWSGVDPKLLIQPIAHQHRVWAVEKDSTRGWYLPPEQLWGIATAFDFGGNYNRGGYLQELITWTVDSGLGPNDYLAAASSAGEIALYRGLDPNDATTWELIGVFYCGASFTPRSWTKYGGDIAFLTQFGLLSMNAVLKPDPHYLLGNPISQKIQRLLSQVITAASDRPNWSIVDYTAENMLLINVPGLVPSQTIQLAYNALTRAWTMFAGMPATCWTSADRELFFGTEGVVYRAWEGYQDFVKLDTTGGQNIAAECQGAFSYFKMPGVLKHYKMIRPTLLYNSRFSYRIGANMDFDFDTLPSPANFGTSNFGIWDQSLWDSDAVWSGGAQTDKQWASVVGYGFAAAPRIAIETNSELIWVATDWLAEPGGVI